MNAPSADPLGACAVAEAGADGVGLFRTEFLFMRRERMPDEDEQAAAYAEAARALGGRRPLTVRTLDVGADKPLPYLEQPAEANPFLGVRGVRLGLASPDLLRTQLRAILRVAAEHPLRVMFPMVTTLDELRAARAELIAYFENLENRNPTKPSVIATVARSLGLPKALVAKALTTPKAVAAGAVKKPRQRIPARRAG